MLPFFTFRVIDIVQTYEKEVELQPLQDPAKVHAKVTVVTVMEVPYQNTLRKNPNIPICSTGIILADSSTQEKPFWASMKTDDTLAPRLFVKESNYSTFKS